MSDQIRPTKIDHGRFHQAVEKLRLHTPNGNASFKDKLVNFAKEHGQTGGSLVYGLSQSNIKSMRSSKAKTPKKLPWLLVYFVFKETNLDITQSQSLQTFFALGFDIELKLDVETRNAEDHNRDLHDLKNLDFRISEAKATAEDPNDEEFELDLRIGFDRTRMTVRADGLRVMGNRVAGEIPLEPIDETTKDYIGWFEMKPASSKPLSWFFDPKEEGKVLNGRIFAEFLAKIETDRGSSLIAEITARRDSLKVRIVDEAGCQKASKSLADHHRDKMCEAIARRSFAEGVDEFVLHRRPLIFENPPVK